MRFAAMTLSVEKYLSSLYITDFMPDCIIALAHSLQGKSVVYILDPWRIFPLLFNIAFNSAWQTKGYLVFKASPSLLQGISLSSHPVGIPLYPRERMWLLGATMHAPT